MSSPTACGSFLSPFHLVYTGTKRVFVFASPCTFCISLVVLLLPFNQIPSCALKSLTPLPSFSRSLYGFFPCSVSTFEFSIYALQLTLLTRSLMAWTVPTQLHWLALVSQVFTCALTENESHFTPASCKRAFSAETVVKFSYSRPSLVFSEVVLSVCVITAPKTALPTSLWKRSVWLCACAVYAPLKRYMTAGMRVGVLGIGGLGHVALQVRI